MHRDVYTAQLLAGIERTVDVNRYMVGETSLWGVFRTLMYFPLREALERDRVSPELARLLHEAYPVEPPTGRDMPATPSSGNTPAFPHGPVVMLASGPSHTTLRQGLHESAIADAWVSMLGNAGLPVVKIDAEASWLSENQPRRYPSFALTGAGEGDHLAAADEVARVWAPAIESMFTAIEATVQRTLGISLSGVLVPFLERVMGFVAQRTAARRWLEQVKPSAVFLLCYYETCYLPIISAARALGIPTVDLQHGMNGTMHAAYTHFTVLPASGYDVLPDWFITWGQHSSENITRWWSSPTRHRVVVGGRWDLDPTSPLSTGEVISAITERASRSSHRVVITMQDEPFAEELLDAMAAAPSDWLWMVRPHPASARYPRASAEALSAQLDAAAVHNAVVVPDQAASLADLLALADVHVTWASSSWLDAAVFGVPTVFVHPGAPEQFSVELAQGVAFAALGGDALVAQVRKLRTLRFSGSPNDPLAMVVNTERDTATRALEAVMGAASQRGVRTTA